MQGLPNKSQHYPNPPKLRTGNLHISTRVKKARIINTHLTFVFFDFSMDFDMISQRVEAGKALATVLTFEGLLHVVPEREREKKERTIKL